MELRLFCIFETACVWNDGGHGTSNYPTVYLLHVSAPVQPIIKQYQQINNYKSAETCTRYSIGVSPSKSVFVSLTTVDYMTKYMAIRFGVTL